MVHKFAFISFSERQRPRPCQYIDSILSCHFRVLGAFPLAIVFLLWRIQLAANGCWRASGHFLVFTICANSRSITILSPSSPTSDNLKKRAKKGCKSNQQLQVTTRLTSFNIQFIVCDQLLHVVPNCQLINSSPLPQLCPLSLPQVHWAGFLPTTAGRGRDASKASDDGCCAAGLRKLNQESKNSTRAIKPKCGRRSSHSSSSASFYYFAVCRQPSREGGGRSRLVLDTAQ